MSGKGGAKPAQAGGLLRRLVKGHAASQPSSASAKLKTALVRAGLFQPDWYLKQNPDLAGHNLDLLEHFLSTGGFEGRAPNPLFNPAWYLARNPDVARERMNPLVHYLLYGERENRNPCVHFDVEWYRDRYQSEIRPDGVLAHYLRHRHLNRYLPNPVFDPAYYLSHNEDVGKAGVDPLEHFLSNGWREGRNPCADFDVQFYAGKYLRNDSRDPLTHYLELGRIAGLPTRPELLEGHSVADEVRRFSSKSSEFEELDPTLAGTLRPRAKALAFYLPQFHAIPENDEWWGKGFTEWTNVARGTPRFVGHYQPRIPRDFGFYDLNDPTVMARQVAAARAAGLEGFCFYYYSFNGRRLLEKPIDDFLARPELDLTFCIMWANENWTRRWDGHEAEVLLSQDYRDQDCETLIDDIARHFADRRYLRIEGRPLFFVYRIDIIPKPRETLEKWRRLFHARHNEEPLIVMAQGFGNFDPVQYGFDGAIEFPPHKVTANLKWANAKCLIFDRAFSGSILKYEDIAEASLSEPAPDFPLIKTVIPSWDNDARRQGRGMSVIGVSPQKYAQWLDRAVRFARRHPFHGEPLVFINAWNEWAEAAYLEPDVHFGGAFLNATARALVGLIGSAQRRKLLLATNEAASTSSQGKLLALGRTLRGQFGTEIRFLLRGNVAAEPFRAVGPVIAADTGDDANRALGDLAATGFRSAILNSPAAGPMAGQLRENGIRTLVIFEEPLSGGEDDIAGARMVAQRAEQVAFASAGLRDAWVRAVGPIRGRVSVLASGSADHAPLNLAPRALGRTTPAESVAPGQAFELLRRLEPGLKRVSVVVPNYNYARFMLERLSSVLGQSYPQYEVIVLDDCSSDDSLVKVSEVSAVMKRRVEVVANTENSGNVFVQWAKGAELARGELIWIAEADDIADPDFLERLAAYFDDPTTAFAFCDSRAIDHAGRLLGESYKDYYARSGEGTLASSLFEDARLFAAKYLSCRNLILNVSSVLWRRERLIKALAESASELSGYKLAGDWRLYLGACALSGKVGYCAEPLNSHRRHEGGVTSRLNAERHLAEIERAQSYFNRVFGEEPSCLSRQRAYREEIRAQFGLDGPPAKAVSACVG